MKMPRFYGLWWTLVNFLNLLFANLPFYLLIRPPGTVVPGRLYVLLLFLYFFIARSPRSVGRSPRNFVTCSEACSIYKC